ncbi:MAG: DUF3256 family protein [Prevotella sp.]|nr:DUF3256 family protein [Prevotella sp.]
MRKYLLGLFLIMLIGQGSAQDLKISDVFREMPDSLMPYLTENNRLDFIDFLDSKMKAEVKNKLGGTSEMVALADDSLSIRMSESLLCDMFLLSLEEPIDTITHVVAVVETFLVDSVYGQSTVSYYTPDWKRLTQMPPLTNEQEKKIQRHYMQNILKREDTIMNER